MNKNFILVAMLGSALVTSFAHADSGPRFFTIDRDTAIPRNVKAVPVAPRVDKSERFMQLPNQRASFYSIRRPSSAVSLPSRASQSVADITAPKNSSAESTNTLAEVFSPAP